MLRKPANHLSDNHESSNHSQKWAVCFKLRFWWNDLVISKPSKCLWLPFAFSGPCCSNSSVLIEFVEVSVYQVRRGRVGGNTGVSEHRCDWSLAFLPCDLGLKWQTCPSLGYGWRRANDMLRGLTWLLAHSELQELTRTRFCHYTPSRPLIREAETRGEASRRDKDANHRLSCWSPADRCEAFWRCDNTLCRKR